MFRPPVIIVPAKHFVSKLANKGQSGLKLYCIILYCVFLLSSYKHMNKGTSESRVNFYSYLHVFITQLRVHNYS